MINGTIIFMFDVLYFVLMIIVIMYIVKINSNIRFTHQMLTRINNFLEEQTKKPVPEKEIDRSQDLEIEYYVSN